MIEYTPIMLGATAGMRLLPEQDQQSIINEVKRIFSKSGFLFISDQWARVITGMEEVFINDYKGCLHVVIN